MKHGLHPRQHLPNIGRFASMRSRTGCFALLVGSLALLHISALADQSCICTNTICGTSDEFPRNIEITVPNSNRKVYKGFETDDCLFVYTNLQAVTCTLDLDLRSPDLLPIAIPKHRIYRMPPAMAHKWPNGDCAVFTNLDDILSDIDHAIELKGSLALCRPSPIWPTGTNDEAEVFRRELLKHATTNSPALINWDEVAKANATVIYKWDVLDNAESNDIDIEGNDRCGDCEIVAGPPQEEGKKADRKCRSSANDSPASSGR